MAVSVPGATWALRTLAEDICENQAAFSSAGVLDRKLRLTGEGAASQSFIGEVRTCNMERSRHLVGEEVICMLGSRSRPSLNHHQHIGAILQNGLYVALMPDNRQLNSRNITP